jgi:hypothetical protein
VREKANSLAGQLSASCCSASIADFTNVAQFSLVTEIMGGEMDSFSEIVYGVLIVVTFAGILYSIPV